MAAQTFTTTIVRDGSICFIPLTFDPKLVFGRVRAPVKVTLNGFTFRSTVAAMGSGAGVPLRRSNREAAGLEGGETIEVRLEADVDRRTVEPPADLVRELKKARGAWQGWRALSFTSQREAVERIEGAKKPDTRTRRVAAAVRLASVKAGTGAATAASAADAPAQIQSYLARLPPDARKALQRLRAAVRAAAPDAVDAFSYAIPAFRLDGRILVWCAAFTAHTSLYPITPALLRAHRIAVTGYATSKGTIRFPLQAPIPSALVKRLVKARVAELRRKKAR
jgi:uncharacterized protein YdhG (YjbR/CyaY superfamily)